VTDEPTALERYAEANRRAWNEVVPLHQKAARNRWDRSFSQPGYVCLDEVELDLLRRLNVKGRDIAHLCCNNGIELLSLKNLGAGTCVGFDISDEAIAEARTRADLCHIACQFVRTDVYRIDAQWDGRFDVIYVSAGALGWLPDLPRFFAQAARLLRAGGCVFIHEIHPVADILAGDDAPDADPLRIQDSYFRTEPYVEYGGLDYVGHTEYASSLPQYWFMHTLSEILMSMIDNGFGVEHLSEYPLDISGGHRRAEEANAGLPLSYVLIGRRG